SENANLISPHGNDTSNPVPNITGSQPWNYTPKSGSSQVFPDGGFFEGFIDLTQIVFPTTGTLCFNQMVFETRSSQSISATLKDFVLGNIETCGSISGRKFNDLNANGAEDAG